MSFDVSTEQWNKLARCCGVEISHDKNRSHANIPCLDSITEFTVTGIPNIISIHNALKKITFITTQGTPLSGCTQVKGRDSCWAEFNVLMEQRFNFLGSVNTKVNKSYYGLSARAPCKDLRWTFRIGNISKSSYSVITELNSESLNEVYIVNNYQYVTVDKISRCSRPLPEWWKVRYHSYQDLDVQKLHIMPFTKPSEDVKMLSCDVAWKEVDHYGHVGYISYITYCFEVIRDASLPCSNANLKDISLLYIKELMVKDKIYVFGWKHQTDKDKNVYRFAIKNSNNFLKKCIMGDLADTIFQAEMTFYE